MRCLHCLGLGSAFTPVLVSMTHGHWSGVRLVSAAQGTSSSPAPSRWWHLCVCVGWVLTEQQSPAQVQGGEVHVYVAEQGVGCSVIEQRGMKTIVGGFPTAIVANYGARSALKPHVFICSEFRKPEVLKCVHGLQPLRVLQGRTISLPFPASRGGPSSLASGPSSSFQASHWHLPVPLSLCSTVTLSCRTLAPLLPSREGLLMTLGPWHNPGNAQSHPFCLR